MPNFDGGHYFLTALLPIGEPDIEDVAGPSLAHRVREALSVLPKARQTPSSVGTGRERDLSSPFARSPRTHFARFVVIDDVVFNGREAVNALRVATDRDRLNPTVHGPCDQLSCPYLLFSADFDAENGTDEQLRSYLVGLWDVMEPELRSVLRHCRDFARVRDANGFADCVIQGQIETTMPFNDYWAEGAPFLPKPEAQPTSGRKPFPWRSLALIAGAVVVTIVLLAGADALFGPRSWWSAPVKALVGLAAAVLVLALLSGPLLEWFGVKLSLARLLALALAIVGFAMIYLAVQTSVAFDGRPQPPPGILNGLISIAAASESSAWPSPPSSSRSVPS
jgi:hypothetical protein